LLLHSFLLMLKAVGTSAATMRRYDLSIRQFQASKTGERIPDPYGAKPVLSYSLRRGLRGYRREMHWQGASIAINIPLWPV